MPAARPELTASLAFLEHRRHIALAVSGGSDSTAMMRLVHDWAGSVSSPPRISVLTVDHRLRPEASREAAEVGDWAAALGLSHQVLSWDGAKPESAVQAKARKARYDLMAGWCRDQGADLLLTAHTKDDQAETVLMRLERTQSPESLAGIPVHGHWQDVALFRPLLGVSRQELRRYLNETGQGWIDDPSNDDSRYERVRTRQRLATLAPKGIDADRLVALGEACRRTAALLDRCASNWIRFHVREQDSGFCDIPTGLLTTLPTELQQKILARVVTHYGGGTMKPEPEELRRLVDWLKEGPVRCTLAGAVLGRRKEKVWVTREASRIDASPAIVPEGGQVVWDGRFVIDAPPGTEIGKSDGTEPHGSPDAPVFARLAYPRISMSEGAEATPTVTFLRLIPPNGTFTM